MAYDSTTGIISAPVSFRDVQRALGTSRHYLNELCTHQNINVWAKYKPVSFNLIDTTKHPTSGIAWLDANKEWNGSAQWWKLRGLDDNTTEEGRNRIACGFSIPFRDSDSLVSNTDLGDWVFHRPTGGASSPYRLIDFNKYYSRAVCPFGVELPTEVYWTAANKIAGKVFLHTYSSRYPAYNLSLEDLIGSGAKLAVAVINNNNIRIKTQEGGVISLEGLEENGFLGRNDTFTIVVFATTSTTSGWSVNDVRAYSLKAPNITFELVGTCQVKPEKANQYFISVRGLSDGDYFAVKNVTKSGSKISGEINRNVQTFSGTYTLDHVTGVLKFVDSTGTKTTVQTITEEPVIGTERFAPETIISNEGPYRWIYCPDFFESYGTPGLSEYYEATYTFYYRNGI